MEPLCRLSEAVSELREAVQDTKSHKSYTEDAAKVLEAAQGALSTLESMVSPRASKGAPAPRPPCIDLTRQLSAGCTRALALPACPAHPPCWRRGWQAPRMARDDLEEVEYQVNPRRRPAHPPSGAGCDVVVCVVCVCVGGGGQVAGGAAGGCLAAVLRRPLRVGPPPRATALLQLAATHVPPLPPAPGPAQVVEAVQQALALLHKHGRESKSFFKGLLKGGSEVPRKFKVNLTALPHAGRRRAGSRPPQVVAAAGSAFEEAAGLAGAGARPRHATPRQ